MLLGSTQKKNSTQTASNLLWCSLPSCKIFSLFEHTALLSIKVHHVIQLLHFQSLLLSLCIMVCFDVYYMRYYASLWKIFLMETAPNMEQAGLYCRGVNGLWGVKQCVLSTRARSKFSFYDHRVHFCFFYFLLHLCTL